VLRVRPSAPPSDTTTAALADLQEKVDQEATYADRVARAKARWQAVDKSGKAFVEIKRLLTDMCWGSRRCMYCEDSLADEIEHFQPKDLYPEFVFSYENYLYACGPCNGPKNNRFGVLEPGKDEVTDVTRGRDDEVEPPLKGEPAFLNPRSDDPLDFLVLDITDTFLFRARPRVGARKKARAEYTIRELHLNDRSYLVEARRVGYAALVCALEAARTRKQEGKDLGPPRLSIEWTPHRSVWEAMKRQRAKVAELAELFEAVTEALDW